VSPGYPPAPPSTCRVARSHEAAASPPQAHPVQDSLIAAMVARSTVTPGQLRTCTYSAVGPSSTPADRK
jgi:hypothetical protein